MSALILRKISLKFYLCEGAALFSYSVMFYYSNIHCLVLVSHCSAAHIRPGSTQLKNMV